MFSMDSHTDSPFVTPLLRGFAITLASHSRLFWTLQIGGWTCFGLMMFGYALAKENLAPAIFDVVALIITGLMLTSASRYLYRRWRARDVTPVWLGLRILILCTLGVPLWWEPQAFLSQVVVKLNPAMVPWVPSYAHIPLDTWVLWEPILLGWSFLYFGINDWIALQIERQRSATAEASLQAARFRVLQFQLQPHFLFNTLNSIASLVLDGRSESAVTMITRVGDFLRLSLQTSEIPTIPLEQEISFIRFYLDIEHMRFGDRLKSQVNISPDAQRALVPTLMLQPLVENAVRHGILPNTAGGTVIISAKIAGNILKIRVEDDGAGLAPTSAPSAGIGLSNTARRLDDLYGKDARMVIGRGTPRGVVVDIEMPCTLSTYSTTAKEGQ
jgi:two-component system, LytTR family, sensor kinase